MRVVTKALRVAQEAAEVYQHASPANILCLLMHKISRAAGEEGVWNARQLLQDWLVRALANYNTNIHTQPTAAMPLQVAASFAMLTCLLRSEQQQECFVCVASLALQHVSSIL